MVNHFARPRRNRGAWLDALLTNQAETVEGAELADLYDFIDTVQGVKHALIAVDNPAPARGYAVILPIFTAPGGVEVPSAAVARVHMIPNQADDAYRALFSQIIVQARNMRAGLAMPYGVEILVDSATAAPHVVEAVERLGAPYAVKMGRSVREELTAPQAGAVDDVADTLAKGEPLIIEADPTALEPAGDGVTEVMELELLSEELDEGAADEVQAEALVEAEETEAPEDAKTEGTEDTGGFECFDCGRTFKSPQALGSHSRSHQLD